MKNLTMTNKQLEVVMDALYAYRIPEFQKENVGHVAAALKNISGVLEQECASCRKMHNINALDENGSCEECANQAGGDWNDHVRNQDSLHD